MFIFNNSLYFCQKRMYYFGMPKKIDHEERKETILKTALAVFAEVGYKEANLSLIAERCGISRPTIYQYFKDKDEIYYYAVKLVTGRLFYELSSIAFAEDDSDEIDRIIKICTLIMDHAIASEAELTRLMEVMLHQKEFNKDFSQIIYKRTAKLSILFKRLLARGMKNGRIKSEFDQDMVTKHIFTLMESFCFQIAFFKNFNRAESLDFLTTYLVFLRA